MTVPNLITTIRIILTPIFIIYLLNGEYVSGLFVFIICVLTDGADGTVARLFSQKSKLGSYLDPLADKLLLVSAFIVLAVIGFLPAWLTVLVITRDILIMIGVMIFYLYGQRITVRPYISSKIATCLQFITVITALSKEYLSSYAGLFPYLFYTTALFVIMSGLQYMHYWFRIMGEGGGSEAE
jgi:cardiolipin synthase